MILLKLDSTLDSVQYFIGFRIQLSQPFQKGVEKIIKTGIKVPSFVKSTKLERWEQIEQIKKNLGKIWNSW